MPDLGLEVLLKGQNMTRLFTGLLAALKISLVSVAISLPLGILLGTLMTWKNPFIKAALRVYLEISAWPQAVSCPGISCNNDPAIKDHLHLCSRYLAAILMGQQAKKYNKNTTR